MCVFVLKQLHTSAGSTTLSQQHWECSQKPEMSPFQKDSLNTAETGSVTLKIIWNERRWWLPKVQAVINQSLPPFSHFTSLLLLCIFPFIVKIEICCRSLSVLPITWNEQAPICSLPTRTFVHLMFLSGHSLLPFFVLFTIFSVFPLVMVLFPRLCPFSNYTLSFPCCEILAQTFRITSKQFPLPYVTC